MDWEVTLRLHDEEQTVVRTTIEAPDEVVAITKAMLKFDDVSFVKVEKVYRA